ncbi:MAG: CoA-binding protein [Acidobacteria bacterium]|nr:CoA-binding protein [Acidobacteriota bacterium]
MTPLPISIEAFLAGGRLVVAGVSRSGSAPANAIFRRLRAAGHEVVPVNPQATEIEGVTCYPSVRAVPGEVHGLLVATHPGVAAQVVGEALDRGIRHIWFHRSFGTGSVSPEAVEVCRARGVEPIVGGCPLMYLPPVDLGHRCFRWWLGRRGRVPV